MTKHDDNHDGTRSGVDPGRKGRGFKGAKGRFCNNNCLFCYDDHTTRYPDLAQAIEAMKVLRETQNRLNVQDFLASEATIHPDFFPLLAKAKELGFTRMGLITNGRMLADEDFSRRTVEAGVQDFRVSIHGATARSHDALTRSKGSFAQSLRGITHLVRLHRKGNWRGSLSVSFVLCRINYPEIQDFLVLMDRFSHPVEVNFVQLIPSPVFAERFASIAAPFSEMKAAVEQGIDWLESLGKTRLQTTFEWPFCILPERAAYLHPPGNCEAVGFACPQHPAPCKTCVYLDRCGGVYKHYANTFGTEELAAQTEDRIPDRKTSRDDDVYL